MRPRTTDPLSPEARATTVRAFWDLVHSHRFDELEEILHEDVERIVLWYDGPDTRRGRDEYVGHLRKVIPSFDEWIVEASEVHPAVDPSRAFMRCRERLTQGERSRVIDELFEFGFAEDGRINLVNIFFKVDPAMASSVLSRYPLETASA